jgi:hypothetical protein
MRIRNAPCCSGVNRANIEVRIGQIITRQVGFARYCRTQAAAIRQGTKLSKFPNIRETMLVLAQHYEQMADSIEQLIRRYPAVADSRRGG